MATSIDGSLVGLREENDPSPYPLKVTHTPGIASELYVKRPRVLVVVDGPNVPAAVARAIDRVAAVPVELVGIGICSHPQPRRRLLGERLAAIADTFDRALFRPNPDAYRLVDLGRTYPGLMTAVTDAASQPGVQPVDLVLDLTSAGLAPSILPSSRLGIWGLRYGEDCLPLGPGTYAREFTRGSGLAVTQLVAHEAPSHPPGVPSGGRVIYRSVGDVDRYSPARTRNAAAWKAAEFPARVLSNSPTEGKSARWEDAGTRPQGAAPLAAGTVVTLVAQVAARGLREVGRRLAARPGWFVAIRVGRLDPTCAWPTSMAGFRPLVAPPGRFFADPFVVSGPTGPLLFVEDAPVGGGPGRISVLELDSTGSASSAPYVALERRTHLSYPFVFEDGGDWYMLPESADTHTLELFRARRFPYDWEPCAVLLQGIRAFDPTLLRYGGLYWLFASVADSGVSPSDELCLYWSEALTGPWHPHPRNPVVSDARHARPAGRILVDGRTLLRPAQDCTGGYGRRVVLNRIELMSLDDYREAQIGSIEPSGIPGVLRTHTYTTDGGIEAVDGLRYERRRWLGRRRDQADGCACSRRG
jgi:hypothetical protein